MISREEAERSVERHLDTARLRRIIINTSVVAWENKITDTKLDHWLENFTGRYFRNAENERKLALWILTHFAYYTLNDVRVLCRALFNKYVHEKLRDDMSSNLTDVINEIIDNTLFVGLGNDSESGNNILYYFRQENHLTKDNFEVESKRDYLNLVYIDDVTISGSQAINYINSRNIKAQNTYVAALIATEDAVKRLADSETEVKTISTMILDERDRAFSESAYAFSDNRVTEIRPIAEEFCRLYGNLAVKGWDYMEQYPLGFADGQYMIGFHYNTPDNTLPIFWGTGNGWVPLFERYPKIYDGKEYILDGRKYY